MSMPIRFGNERAMISLTSCSSDSGASVGCLVGCSSRTNVAAETGAPFAEPGERSRAGKTHANIHELVMLKDSGHRGQVWAAPLGVVHPDALGRCACTLSRARPACAPALEPRRNARFPHQSRTR